MNLENTTESLCDQLKKFVVEQMEEKRMLEESLEERREVVAKVFAIIGLVILSIAILVGLRFLIPHLWRTWKSRRAGPVTRIPKTPIKNKNLLEWNLMEWSRDEFNRAKIYKGTIGHKSNRCYKKLEEIMKVVFNLNWCPYMTYQPRIITIRMDGFSNGAEFHDFEPTDGVIAGSHFTYQIYGEDTIQVTRYVVGKKSYVAGFCIYVKNYSVEYDDISMNVIKKLLKEAKYPGKEAVEMGLNEELEKESKIDKTFIPSKFTFWKRASQGSEMKTEQNDVPPSYSFISIA